MKARHAYNLRSTIWALVVSELVFWLLVGLAYVVARLFMSNIRYEHFDFAWLLLIVPVVSLLQILVLYMRNRGFRRYADRDLVPEVAPHISTQRMVVKFILFRLGLALVIIGIIGPKAGMGKREVKTEGMEIMLCIDVSNSMLAEDLSPNRLELSKRAVEQMIRRLAGDQIGIVVFAGDAYVQLPMTTDYEAAKMFASGISTDMVSRQGTAIGAAIDLALLSFKPSGQADKTIIVLTDGENHEDNALAAAARARDMGVTVHAIGLGSGTGAPIPIYRNGRRIGFKEDRAGNTVVTALNEGMLQALVQESGGLFVKSGKRDVGLSALMAELEKAEREEQESYTFKEFKQRFPWFIEIGLLLLLAEALIAERRKKWSENFNLLD